MKKIILFIILGITLVSCSTATHHTVRRGENLTKISKNSGVSISELKDINHLTSDKIVVGQVIYFKKAKNNNKLLEVTHLGGPRLDHEGIEMIKRFEQLRTKSYQDSGGVWTIGYGHTGDDVGRWTRISEKRAIELLEDDVSATERGVEKVLKVKTTQHKFNAMVSLAFNVGVSNFRQSTLLKLHNKGQFTKASYEFKKWSKVKGKTNKGLLKRRAIEAKIYQTQSENYIN
ncbi:MAG: glycoside hydrolase family protein [Psychrilyobacter sp.]|nr:glycoside hydrolase family protein [Psychrilyobacter sp.]